MDRTLAYPFIYLLLMVSFTSKSNAQCPASSPLVINSVTTTESRCQASGTATVSASGGSTPYTYSIIAGPGTAPAQSSNVFSSLAPGTYTVQVTDNCNTSVTASVTVAGTYAIPSPTFSTQSPSCSGSSDGSLTVNVAGGRAPLTYSLISPSPVTAGSQTSNVFSGLPAGTYTCQVADSCGNFETRTVAVPAGNSGIIILTTNLQYISCDSFAYTIYINVANLINYKPPFTISITLQNGTVITHVLTAPAVSGGYVTDTYNFRHDPNTGASDPVTTTVTNNCGASQSSTVNVSGLLAMHVTFTTSSSCIPLYTYTFDAGQDNSTGPSQVHCGTITYTLVSPSGAVLATQTNNSTFAGYPAGNGYKVIRQDCCEKDSLGFNWAVSTNPSPYPIFMFGDQILPGAACKDGTTGLSLSFGDASGVATGYAVVASGPPSVTFSDGTVHTYTYPDTLQNQDFSQGSIILSGFTTGTYKIVLVDACANTGSMTVTINPSNLRHDTFTATAVKGCPNANEILLNATSTATDGVDFFATVFGTSGNSFATADAYTSPYTGSLTGLSSGNWNVTYNYNNYYLGQETFLQGMGNYSCDVFNNTFVIPPYTQPVFAATPAVANCGTVRDVALLPDSSNGVQPYQYQIIAGPTTTSAQSSPVFPGLSAGTYTFQMSDACANSYSSSITINALARPNVSTTGGNCAGGAATFTVPGSPFYNYTWLHPDGTTTNGDTLAFNPITNADTGKYTITLTSTVGGCTSTSSEQVVLGFCTVLQETLLHFSGQQKAGNIQLNWQTADETGIGYYLVGRSTDGLSFTPIRQLEATDAAQNAYTATDTHVPSGVVYYRLQILGKDGALSYSQIISFNMENTPSFNVYPRLITGNTPVRCTYPGATNTGFIRLVGIDGRVYRTITVPAGSTTTSIDITGLARGNYFVVFAGNDMVAATQVWKE
jgi:hypothetical protein